MKIAPLSKRADFNLLFKTGKRIYKTYFKISYLFKEGSQAEGSTLYVSYVVSKKISSKAVVRNKIRRRLRDILRTEIQLLNKNGDIKASPIDILMVVLTAKSIVDVSFQQINSEFQEGLKQIGNNYERYCENNK